MEEGSAADLGEARADSDKAGQPTAPITGPASTTPFDGLFHAGFLGRAAALLLLFSSPCSRETPAFGSGGGSEEAGEQSETATWSANGDDDEDGEYGE